MHRGPQQPWSQAHGYGWPSHDGRPVFVPVYRTRYYRSVVVIRPYGRLYPGYGYYQSDDDAYRWLAFTAITLKILDNLNEAQERAHEEAQAQATTASVGDTIVWNQSGASGAVTVLRDGYSTSGRYCREFQQQVTIGGQTEQAYGTACQQPDGAWQVVSTGS
jgi:17 kDa outer membrane surface antigen